MKRLVLTLIAQIVAVTLFAGVKVHSLRVEAQENPVGIDVQSPDFSWKISDNNSRGVYQTAYLINVYSDTDMGNLVWSSGKVESDDCIDIPFKGTLSPSSCYYWRVKIWDNHGRVAESKEQAFFKTGLMDSGWSGAEWIENNHNIGDDRVSYFRNEFELDTKNILSAKLYCSALGVFDVFINGTKVGSDELKPGWTDYRYEIHYMNYDVTELLTNGANVLASQVSNGWWRGAISRNVYESKSLAFIAKLQIEYKDGTVKNIVTDRSWETGMTGSTIKGDIYNGELYDARNSDSWKYVGFEDSTWESVVINGYRGKLISHQGPTVQILDKEYWRTPKRITIYNGAVETGTTYGKINVVAEYDRPTKIHLKKGETAIFDLGQNMVGWVDFTVKGKRGTELDFDFGEMLNYSGDKERLDDGPAGSVWTFNLRSADAHLKYILSGDKAGESYHPSTTFYGFQYVSLTATDDVIIEQLVGQVVGTKLDESSTFECSDSDINTLYSNVRWGQRGNFLSVPTDCPQRDERLGWTGDTQIFCKAATYNADTRAFYRKWMRDLRNSQRADGAYPDIAPFPNFWDYDNAGWADAGVIVPWSIYMMTGDIQILEENFDSVTKYMKYLSTRSEGEYKYIGPGVVTGDWLAYEEMDPRISAMAHYAYDALLMKEIVTILGKPGAEEYQALYENIKAEFQKRYMNPDGTIKQGTQTSYLLALKHNLLPDNYLEQTKAILRDKIVNNGYKLSTGFIGTGILNTTLTDFGMDDLAYSLLQQRENPSWLYSIDQGATTVWERWDSYTVEQGFHKHPWNMNSFNHYSYGAVTEWMFSHMCGIRFDKELPAFKHIILKPIPDRREFFPANQSRITWAKANHNSVYGNIISEWNFNQNGGVDYRVTIPANTYATLYYPITSINEIVMESGKSLEKADGVEIVESGNGVLVLKLQSGSYSFKSVM